MPFKFFLCILTALSLLAGFLLLRLAVFLMPPGQGGAYAVLILDEALPDRQIRGLLSNNRAISESSQYVLLDDFSGLATVPLDEYPARLFPFDPRNDGYAERLRAFFVRDGKRFVYIPLGPGAGDRLEKDLAAALGDIPFQLEYSGGGRPAGFYLLLLALAGAGALWLTRRLMLAPCVPVLAGLALAGPAGLAAAAFFMGLGALLRAPCGEYFMHRRYKKTGIPLGAGENRPLREILGPFKKRLFWTPLFGGALAACAVPGGVHPLLILGTGIGFAGIFLFSQWAVSRRGEGQDHVRFSPVLILKVPAFNREFSRSMLPYATAALLAIPLSLAVSGPASPDASSPLKNTPPPIREAEYRAHAAFQAAFSFQPLGQDPRGPSQPAAEPAWYRYIPGDDGLVAGRERVSSGEPAYAATVPPFALGNLMAALEPGNHAAPGRGPAFGELPPVFMALLLSVPALLRFRRGDKNGKTRLLYREKGIAA
jgi:hypothetical protein